MSAPPHTVPFSILSVIMTLWPRCPNEGLAMAVNVPRSTAQSWLLGKRKMPAAAMQRFADYLKQLHGAALSVEYDARAAARRITPRAGFFVVKDWGDGVIRDARW